MNVDNEPLREKGLCPQLLLIRVGKPGVFNWHRGRHKEDNVPHFQKDIEKWGLGLEIEGSQETDLQGQMETALS